MKSKLKRIGTFGLFMCITIAQGVWALSDGQALTPPLGWSSWNWFGCYQTSRPSSFPGGGINEAKILSIADSMISSGMKGVGYRYINLDDCYLENRRNASGGLVAKQATFPKGMKALADSIHKRGLKIGFYTCLFDMTCGEYFDGAGHGQPGLWGHERQDCDSFVAWGADYLKVDYCNYQNHTPERPSFFYGRIRDSIKAAVARAKLNGNANAHDMVFSICEWGRNTPWTWAGPVGHMWRIKNDIWKTWASMIGQIDVLKDLSRYQSPGSWNDADMMEVGNGLAPNEDRAHFCLWSVFGIPMIAGNDLRNMTPATKALVTAPWPHYINQDSLGLQGRVVSGATTGPFIVLKKMKQREYAICMVNGGTAASTMTVTWGQIAVIDTFPDKIVATDSMIVRNVLTGQILDTVVGSFSQSSVPSHDVFYVLLTPLRKTSVKEIIRRQSHEFKFSVMQMPNNVSIHTVYKNPFTISLYDVKGSCLQRIRSQGQTDWTLPVDKIGAGVFFLTMKSGDKIATRQLILK